MEERCDDKVESVNYSERGNSAGWLAHRESIFLNGEARSIDTY